jgi:hypothetical protein
VGTVHSETACPSVRPCAYIATFTALFGLAPAHKKALSTDSVSASALERWQNFVAPQQTKFFTFFTSVNEIIDYSVGND